MSQLIIQQQSKNHYKSGKCQVRAKAILVRSPPTNIISKNGSQICAPVMKPSWCECENNSFCKEGDYTSTPLGGSRCKTIARQHYRDSLD